MTFLQFYFEDLFDSDFRLPKFKLFHPNFFKVKNNMKRKLLALAQSTKRKEEKVACTMVLLSHMNLRKWQSIPCDAKVLDLTTLLCTNSLSENGQLQEHGSSFNFYQTHNVKSMFQCQGGSFISSKLLCDQEADCPRGDDEISCTCSDSHNQSASCNKLFSGLSCTCSTLYKIKPGKRCIFPLPGDASLSAKIPQSQTIQFKCFDKAVKCRYILDEASGNLKHCSTGMHLEDCSKYNCEEKYAFKCAHYYCIPWRYVCNGRFDCPWEYDEQNCEARFKPGLYKCHSSALHIHPMDICNFQRDCPNGDDEELCYLHDRLCPSCCICLGFVLRCTCIPTGRQQSTVTKGTFLFLRQSNILQVNSSSLRYFCNLELLDLRENHLEVVLFDSERTILNKSLHTIHLSVNCIGQLFQNFLIQFQHLKNIFMSFNLISDIECGSFQGKSEAKIVDLSFNALQNLKECTLAGFQNLNFLNLSQNDIHSLEPGTSLANIVLDLSSSSFVVCCVAEHLSCNKKPPWPYSCNNLIGNVGLKVTLWTVGVTASFLNVASVVRSIVNLLTAKQESYSLLLLSVSASDLTFAFVLIAIASTDSYFGDKYILQNFVWRKHIFCHTIGALVLFSLLLNIQSLVAVAVVRYSVVSSPIDSKCKECAVTGKVVLSSALSAFVFSAGSATFAVLMDPNKQQSTGTCLMIGQSDAYLPSTIVLVLFESIASIAIPVAYFLLIKNLQKSRKAWMSSAHHNKRTRTSSTKVIIAGLTNLLCWLPSIVIFTITLTVTQYNAQLVLYTLVTAMPINSLLNPIILNVKCRCGKTHPDGQK